MNILDEILVGIVSGITVQFFPEIREKFFNPLIYRIKQVYWCNKRNMFPREIWFYSQEKEPNKKILIKVCRKIRFFHSVRFIFLCKFMGKNPKIKYNYELEYK